MERRLTTILIADVVGYSRLMAVDEAGTLSALKSHRAEVIEPAAARHSGRIVKLMGDGALMEFASVAGAVGFAVDVQRATAARNTGTAADQRVEFRIGINMGDVLVEGGDLYGDGVNVAARLEALSEPGGICISEAVYQQSRKKAGLMFEDLGLQQFKNMAEPLRAYGIRFGEAQHAPRPAPKAKPPRIEEARGSLVVFPFDSLSQDREDAFLSDGITSEIINMLSRMPDLRVASRSAVFAARDRQEDAWQIVSEQQFRYVLTGSVRRAGDRLRVIAELAEAATQTQLWSSTYDRQVADVFEVQEDIAEAIVGAFGGEILRAEWRLARTRERTHLDAWELVHKAQALNLPVNRDAIGEALKLAEEAVRVDPGYAGAHARLASVLVQGVISGISTDAEGDRAAALAAAARAAELAPDDAQVMRIQAKVLSTCGRQDHAIAALRRAVELAPFDFHSWGRLGRTLAYRADPDGLREGQEILDRILAVAPNHPMVPYWLYFKATACALDGRHEDAARHARRSVDIQPGYAGAWMALANALGFLGRNEEAREALESALRANPSMTPSHLAEQIRIAAAGDGDYAERALGGLKAAGLL